MIKQKSLKKEILVALLAFSSFVAVSIGFISVLNFYLSKLTIIEHNQKQTIYQVESEVNKFLMQIYNLSIYIRHNYNQSGTLLKNIVDTNDNVSTILILSKKGILEDFYSKSSPEIIKGFDYSNEEYFEEIENGKEDYWSNIFLSAMEKEPTLSYSFTLRNKVVVLVFKLNEISDFISKFKNQDGTYMIKIFDSKGNVILNPNNPDFVLHRFNEKNQKIFTELIDKLQPYTFTIFYSKIFNQNQYGTYTIVKKTGWKIVVCESYELILKSLNNIIFGTIFTILIFICAAIFLSLKMSERIFRSLDDLQQTTTNIAEGNYSIENKKSYYSEFNILLKSFNRMKIEIDKREDSLEASLDSFKSLFNSTMEAIVIHDKGICIDANNVTINFLGLEKKEELIGKNLLEYVDDKYKELVIKNYKENTFPYEFDLLIKGHKVTCLGQGKFIKLDGKEVKLSTLIDITELKQKDKLLFQQSKMASMGEMIGNIAHQWRQPLSLISTCASGIKLEKEFSKTKDERLFESLDLIVENTQYLSKTIDDFRNFFKADKIVEDFCINESIEKVLKLLKSSIQNHNIQIETSYVENLIIHGYPNEFLQVIINILNNAKDALVQIEKNERFIDIKTYVKNKRCYVEIIDNAGGVNEDIISKVFEPYFTTKHKYQGTGIGLYMSHQIIVEHMGGLIYLQNIEIVKNNKLFTGCCVTIEIPIKDDKFIDYII